MEEGGVRNTAKRQRQHKVFCHVITRAFQLHLLSQGSQFFIYNSVHCMPVSARLKCQSVWVWVIRGVEERANSFGVSCLLSTLYAHASERHQHFWICAQSTTPWSSGSFFLIIELTVLCRKRLHGWTDSTDVVIFTIKFHNELDQVLILLHLDMWEKLS